jgi:hypothetical protein
MSVPPACYAGGFKPMKNLTMHSVHALCAMPVSRLSVPTIIKGAL